MKMRRSSHSLTGRSFWTPSEWIPSAQEQDSHETPQEKDANDDKELTNDDKGLANDDKELANDDVELANDDDEDSGTKILSVLEN